MQLAQMARVTGARRLMATTMPARAPDEDVRVAAAASAAALPLPRRDVPTAWLSTLPAGRTPVASTALTA